MASGPLIIGNNANFGGGPIQTFDFSTGGPPVAEFVPTGASDSNNGRGLEVIGSEVFYTELSGGFGETLSIEVAPYSGGAGGSDTRTLPNPRPGTGTQDLAASGGSLYALTGYPSSPLEVFKLNPSSGEVLAGPISIAAPASPSSDGFTVLPNGNFLINDTDLSCVYNQYNGSTGELVSETTIIVPGAGSCTGVDNDGTSLFFQTDFSSFTQTDMSGKLVATKAVSGENQGIEDISLIQPAAQFDHYLCYKTKGADIPPPVTLIDQFDEAEGTQEHVEPIVLKQLCNPLFEKNHQKVLVDPVIHLTKYPFTPQPRVKTVEIENQFETTRVTTVAAVELRVPTTKDLNKPPAPPTGEEFSYEHYKCYTLQKAPFTKRTVLVTDQFGAHKLHIVSRARLCNPVTKITSTGTFPIRNRERHLVCYVVELKREGLPTRVFTNNQFGPEQLRLSPAQELCLPSRKR